MNRSLLINATSSDKEPVHGYDLAQIIQLSYAKPEACYQLEEFLLQRIQKDNPHTKLKSLRVIRHLAEKGKPDFKRSIRKKAEPIRYYQTYQGKPDVIYGDSYNKQIREEATKCLAAIFSDDVDQQSKYAHRIEGIGSSYMDKSTEGSTHHNTTSYDSQRNPTNFSSSSTQRGKYIGMGNPNFDHNFDYYNQKSYTSSALKALTEVADRYFPSVKDTIIKNAPQFNPTHQDKHMDKRNYNTYQNKFQNRRPDGVPYYDQKYSYSNGNENTTNEYETKLIDNLLAPGGVLPTIPSSSLDGFIIKCRSLDIEVIGRILYQRFIKKESDDTTKTRSLMVIATLLSSEDPLIQQQRSTLENITKENFIPNLKDVIKQPLSKPELKDKASTILKLLNIEFDDQKVKTQNIIEENLLEFNNVNETSIDPIEFDNDSSTDIFSTMNTSEPIQKKDDIYWDLFDSPKSSSYKDSNNYLDLFEVNAKPKESTKTISPSLFENLTHYPNQSNSSIKSPTYTTQFGNFIYHSEIPPPNISTSFPFEENISKPLDDPFVTLIGSSLNNPKTESFPSIKRNSMDKLTNLQDTFISEIFGDINTPKQNTPTPSFDVFKNF